MDGKIVVKGINYDNLGHLIQTYRKSPMYAVSQQNTPTPGRPLLPFGYVRPCRETLSLRTCCVLLSMAHVRTTYLRTPGWQCAVVAKRLPYWQPCSSIVCAYLERGILCTELSSCVLWCIHAHAVCRLLVCRSPVCICSLTGYIAYTPA